VVHCAWVRAADAEDDNDGRTPVRIGIVAAFPGELKPLVRGWDHASAQGGTQTWTHREGDDTWVAVCSGMGADAARRAFAAAETDGSLEMVLSVGWAGALDGGIRPGEARAVSVIVDGDTSERFILGGERRNLTLVTVARVADQAGKMNLRRDFAGAMLVDMEAATVARLAQERGIAMGCVKGVSDGLESMMPDLNPFVDPMGQLRMAPFLLHLALQPKYWRPVMELGSNSARAAGAMRDLILEFLQQKNVERIRTGNI
jgi:adenosylhomocysteine nucleosidase